MSIKQARIEGGKAFRNQWGPTLLAILLASAGLIVASAAVPVIGTYIVSGPITVGLFYVLNKGLHGEKIEYKEMLYGFKTNFGEIVLGVLIKDAFFVGIAFAAWGLISTLGLGFSFIPIVSVIIIVLIVIAAIVALIIFSLYLAAVEYILMREPDAKGWEAVKKSKRIMTGNIGRYFGFVISFIGWFILTGIFFPLAIYTFPYFYMSKICFLGSIYDEAERRAKEPVYTASPAPQAPLATGEMAPQDEAAPKAPAKFCKHCGNPLPEEAMFCSNCGRSQAPEGMTPAPEIQTEADAFKEETKEAAAENAEEIKEAAADAAEEVKEAAADVAGAISEEIKTEE